MTATDDVPSDGAILERAFSLANEAMFTVALQRGRVRGTEPEDESFVFRWWADLQFLIVALRRLRRAAELARRVPAAAGDVAAALKAFDVALPMLPMMRNVGEHIDDYALDRGRDKHVSRQALQVGAWDGRTYSWLGESLNVDVAHAAAEGLWSAVRAALTSVAREQPPPPQA
jgi:hypothetical protein